MATLLNVYAGTGVSALYTCCFLVLEYSTFVAQLWKTGRRIMKKKI
ncbi:hypothetical protein C7459_102230 [Tumebacillus permanentifrigoris]|uniref:Uncharacterized protein n=1 Tax=Tumebacillus permanentifrigoris TaxID=378543 RepID=A0A316DDA2_9BACL|nr:hypothetical protein C7459_102230 [Tumebacillus permanentifrigoris]